LLDRFLQPAGDGRRHQRVPRVMPQHFLHAGELPRGRRLRLLLLGRELFLFLLSKFALAFHVCTSNGFLEQDGKGLPGAVQLAADRVGGLIGQRADLFVTHFFIGDQQQQEPMFRRQPIKRLLDTLP